MDFSAGNIPIDIIVFALIALFLILRLRSVLGKKIGFDKKNASILSIKPSNFLPTNKNKSVNKPVEPSRPQVEFVIPPQNTQLGQILQDIQNADAGFVVQKFMEGTETVFRNVLLAFAAGDLNKLQSLLTPETYEAFKSAIEEREKLQERQKIDIQRIHSITITNASFQKQSPFPVADIEVKIISDQVNCKFNKDNNPVVGTESVTEFIDFWVFERLIGINNGQAVSWRLKSARSGN